MHMNEQGITLQHGKHCPGTKSEGHIYLFFAGWPQGGGTMARFNLSWLLQGEKTGDGELPKWITATGH